MQHSDCNPHWNCSIRMTITTTNQKLRFTGSSTRCTLAAPLFHIGTAALRVEHVSGSHDVGGENLQMPTVWLCAHIVQSCDVDKRGNCTRAPNCLCVAFRLCTAIANVDVWCRQNTLVIDPMCIFSVCVCLFLWLCTKLPFVFAFAFEC